LHSIAPFRVPTAGESESALALSAPGARNRKLHSAHHTQAVLSYTFYQQQARGVLKRHLWRIVAMSLALEFVGAVILYPGFSSQKVTERRGLRARNRPK